MSEYLPPQFRPEYTALLAKKLLVCVVIVAWKLEQPESWPLACVGEQLALRAMIERAEVELELEGKEADFDEFWDLGFPDNDILMLFDPAWDGIEDSDIGDHLGTGALALRHWFDPPFTTSCASIPTRRRILDERRRTNGMRSARMTERRSHCWTSNSGDRIRGNPGSAVRST